MISPKLQQHWLQGTPWDTSTHAHVCVVSGCPVLYHHIAENFEGENFHRENFHGLLACVAKRHHAQIFAEKTFLNRHKTSKFAKKIFSSKVSAAV